MNEECRDGWTTGNCCECGKEFSLLERRKLLAREIFCGIECYRTRCNHTHINRICENCGEEFSRPQSVKQTKFCCWSCYREFEPQQTHDVKFNFGHFVSTKAGLVHFDSNWELRRMKELDTDDSVIIWARSKHCIPWIDVNNKQKLYYPDFDVEYVDGTKIIEEVKGHINESSRLKIEAGKKYCAEHNLQYHVLNDRDFKEFEEAAEFYDNDYGTWSRPTFESVFMKIAQQFAMRSTCIRLQVGAVFVDPTYTRILCLGYNGTVSGDLNQCESLLPGTCGCVHAEVNAMMHATDSLNDSILFVTTAPCKACSKLLVIRGVKKVVYGRAYRDKSGIMFLQQHGIDVISWHKYVRTCDETFFANQFNEKLIKPQLQIDACDDACCSMIPRAILNVREKK